MNLILLFNVFLVWFCWDQAKKDFADGKNFWGWGFIALSAFNFTAVAMELSK